MEKNRILLCCPCQLSWGVTKSHFLVKINPNYMLWMTVLAVQYSSMSVCWCCVCLSLFGSLPLCFSLRAGRSLEHSHSNMALQNACPPFPNKIWMHKRKKSSLTPLRVSAASLQPCALSPGFAAVFLWLLRRPHTPQSVSVITVECRLFWRRLTALTGFGVGACQGSMRTSRLVVTRQRVKQCDRYYSVYPFSNYSLDVMLHFSAK